jgi:hypothetical protein
VRWEDRWEGSIEVKVGGKNGPKKMTVKKIKSNVSSQKKMIVVQCGLM